MTASLRVFGPERVVFWRESSHGSSAVAYFLGKDLSQVCTIDLHTFSQLYPQIPLYLYSLVFVIVYYPITVPRASFSTWLGILLLVQFSASGIGHVHHTQHQILTRPQSDTWSQSSSNHPWHNSLAPCSSLYHACSQVLDPHSTK